MIRSIFSKLSSHLEDPGVSNILGSSSSSSSAPASTSASTSNSTNTSIETSRSVPGLLSVPDASTRKMFEAMEPLQFSQKDLDFGRE